MTNAIEIKNLCKQYPGFALKNISFCVPEGLCCGLIGANGAGKTTTLKILAGMTAADGGEIRLLGRPGGDISIKKDIGILFDQPYFPEDWTPRATLEEIVIFMEREAADNKNSTAICMHGKSM